MQDQYVRENLTAVCKYFQTGYCRNGKNVTSYMKTTPAKKEFVETKIAEIYIQGPVNTFQSIITADIKNSVHILIILINTA